MTTFTDPFGGETIPPGNYSYAQYNVAASITLVWPNQYAGVNTLIADILELNVTSASLSATLPPANAESTGRDVLIRNTGSQTINILDNAGGAVTTIAAGESKYVYITNNATAAGTWSSFTFGTGTSAADASQLAGLGLQSSSGLIRVYLAYLAKSANYQITANDRAKLINVTSGVVTLTLPQASVAGEGYYIALRNSGSGSVTIEGWGTEMVNGSLSYTLNQNESTLIATDGSSWYTIGQGKDATFAFSEFVVNAAAGSVVLTAADVAGRMIRIAGTAVGNITVTLPAIDNIYFVNTESGLGGFSVTFTTGAGATLALGANLRTVIYSDGTNIRTAVSTTVTSAISLDDGSDAAPSLTFALDSNLGLFRLGADQMGFTANGTQVGFWDVNGWNGPAILTGTPTAPTAAAGTNTTQIATTAHVFAERSNALTLTNKTFNLASNTLTGTKAQFDTALSDDNFGYLATANVWTAVQSIDISNPTRGILSKLRNTAGAAWTGAQLQLTQLGVADWAFGQPAGVSALAWWSGRSDTADGAERMRLTSAGFLGVGLSAPDSYIHSLGDITNGGAGAQLGTIIGAGYSAVPSGVKCNIGAANSTFGLVAGSLFMQPRTGVNATINFYTEGSERFRILATGAAQFSVPTNDGVRITDGTREARLIPSSAGAGSLAIVTPGAFGISFWTNNTERARFLSTGNLEILPYTKLGESSPAIKTKKLTGTTNAAEGGLTTVAHGLTGSKILSVDVLVDFGVGGRIGPGADAGSGLGTGREFAVSTDATNVTVQLHPTNSEIILSKAFTVFVVYEE